MFGISSNRLQKLYNLRPPEESTRLLPFISVDRMLHSLTPSNYTVQSVIMPFELYFKNLATIVDNAPSDVMEKYLIWRLIAARSEVVLSDTLEPCTRFYNMLNGRVRAALLP